MRILNPAPTAATAALPEAAARRVLLVQAYDSSPASDPLWTVEDRAWATRLARETTPADAAPGQFLEERARHALQRLLPRDSAAARALNQRLWRPLWVGVAVAVGLLAGIGVDAIGSSQRINLLAPPVWAVIVWNLAVYLGLLWPVPRGLRAAVARRLGGTVSLSESPRQTFQQAWARLAAALTLARAALLLHAAAAALAVGLIAGLYLRGLVLDYRAGWQSTFLQAPQVHAALALLLAPAAALTGISVPDVATLQALRVGPAVLPLPSATGTGTGTATATAIASATASPTSAAPWLHLYATMLLLCVVLPRTMLAAVAAGRAQRLAHDFPLPLSDLYFVRLLHAWRGDAAIVQVLPHGAAPAAAALAGLQALLAAGLGEGLQMHVAAAITHGDEDLAALPPLPLGTTLRVLLVDLAATPEDEAHGRQVQALRLQAPTLALLLLADESALRLRFATLPVRVAERRAAWQAWAASQGLRFFSANLRQPDIAAAQAALQSALTA